MLISTKRSIRVPSGPEGARSAPNRNRILKIRSEERSPFTKHGTAIGTRNWLAASAALPYTDISIMTGILRKAAWPAKATARSNSLATHATGLAEPRKFRAASLSAAFSANSTGPGSGSGTHPTKPCIYGQLHRTCRYQSAARFLFWKSKTLPSFKLRALFLKTEATA